MVGLVRPVEPTPQLGAPLVDPTIDTKSARQESERDDRDEKSDENHDALLNGMSPDELRRNVPRAIRHVVQRATGLGIRRRCPGPRSQLLAKRDQQATQEQERAMARRWPLLT